MASVPYCASTRPWSMDEYAALRVPHDYDALVVGACPDFSYRQLCYAAAVLRETRGCALVATNPDAGDRITASRIMPGTGCVVAAVELATERRAVRCARNLTLWRTCRMSAAQPAVFWWQRPRLPAYFQSCTLVRLDFSKQ